MHDAMAFNNLNTGRNYTLEWYELVELFNCTFAHVLSNESMVWCNQGAACIYDGVDDKHWRENGTLAKVAVITGIFIMNHVRQTKLLCFLSCLTLSHIQQNCSRRL